MRPPFCPIPFCAFHDPRVPRRYGEWYKLAGTHPTKVVGPVQRYQCYFCRHTFSDRTFDVDYYTKKTIPYRDLMERLASAESVRAMARNLRRSPGSILNRFDRLSRECIARHHRILGSLALAEDLAADGFESFDRSQYFPNNINLLVGSDSQYVYGFSHTTIRRKGSMTTHQKRVRAGLERSYRAPPDGVQTSFRELLSVIAEVWDRGTKPRLVLATDRHRAYPRSIDEVEALATVREEGSFRHLRISSRAARTTDNPLFPVNYLDRELRKDIAAYHRESCCFVRNVANGLNRLIVYLYWHNYFKPWRIRTAKVAEPVHGSMGGVSLRAIGQAKGLFAKRKRVYLSHLNLEGLERRSWGKEWATPLWGKPAYLPAYAFR